MEKHNLQALLFCWQTERQMPVELPNKGKNNTRNIVHISFCCRVSCLYNRWSFSLELNLRDNRAAFKSIVHSLKLVVCCSIFNLLNYQFIEFTALMILSQIVNGDWTINQNTYSLTVLQPRQVLHTVKQY